ncbi:YbfB/YjiJ family MFS transporter [Psychrobacter sp. B38]|uniref:YbfB/YjiJ family MFS transporter n=1 Tax=Psychrobacter sp. B38 TaxID=3143538 RepID=UPI00320CA42C
MSRLYPVSNSILRFRKVFYHFLVLLAISMLVLAVWPSQLVTVFFSAALFGVTYIMLTGIYLVWGIRVYDDRPAIGLGLPFLVLAIGQIIGTLVAGMLIEATNHLITFIIFAGIGLIPIFLKYKSEVSV